MLAVVIGRRRQGKSTLALSLAIAQQRSVIIWDPNDQYGAIPSIQPAELDGWMASSGSDDMVRIVPAPPVEDTWTQIVETLDGGKWRWADYTLIVDECSMLMSPARLDSSLERYARTSPSDVDVILTTHRPRDVHSLIRALASDLYVFQTTLARDLQVLTENYGSELAEAVQRLGQYHVVHCWLAAGGRQQIVVWDKPSEWYIDIGRRS